MIEPGARAPDSSSRTTFLIGPDGTVQKVLRNVKPAEHDDLVLSELRPAA